MLNVEEVEPDLLNEEEEEYMGEEPIVTLNNISNSNLSQTLRYSGSMQDIPICVLIDTGASHSFIHPKLVQSLNLPTTNTTPNSKMCYGQYSGF